MQRIALTRSLAVGGGEERQREACRRAGMLTGDAGADAPLFELFREMLYWLAEPLVADGGFLVDDAYLRRGIEFLSESARRGSARYLPICTWMNRLFYGARAIFYRLHAPADCRRVHEEELDLAGLR